MRNLQLSLYGLPFSMLYMWFKDGTSRQNMVQVRLSPYSQKLRKHFA